MEGDLGGVVRIRPVEHRHAALVPRLHHDVPTWNRDQRSIVGDAVLDGGLRHRQLVVAAEAHLTVRDGEDRVAAPLRGIVCATLGGTAAPPLVGEEHFRPIVVEGGRVPVGEVGVAHRRDTARIHRIPDVEQQAVAFAGAAGEPDRRIDGDVVTLCRTGARPVVAFAHHPRSHAGELLAQRGAVGCGGGSGASPRLHDAVEHRRDPAVGQHEVLTAELGDVRAARTRLLDRRKVVRRSTMARRGDEIREDPRRVHDRRLLRIRQRNSDHLDPEEGGVRIVAGHPASAPGKLRRGTHWRRSGHVDVDVLGVAGVLEHGVRMRAATRLHIADVAGIPNVADVEDTNTAQALSTHRFTHALRAAVEPPLEPFARNEQEVPIHRHIALRGGADVPVHEHRLPRIGEVPDLEAVVVPLDRVVPGEREVRVHAANELARRRRGRELAQVPDRLFGVEHSRAKTDAWIGGGRRGRHADACRRRRWRSASRCRAACGKKQRCDRDQRAGTP